MVSAFFSCCGLLSARVSRKSRETQEREKEYTRDFDFLKEKNAERVRHLSNAGVKGYEGFSAKNSMASQREARIESGCLETRNGGAGAVTETERDGSSGDSSEGLVRGLPTYDDVVASNPRT